MRSQLKSEQKSKSFMYSYETQSQRKDSTILKSCASPYLRFKERTANFCFVWGHLSITAWGQEQSSMTSFMEPTWKS
jgi:hypothetical protein